MNPKKSGLLSPCIRSENSRTSIARVQNATAPSRSVKDETR